jgi:hypothetical protein
MSEDNKIPDNKSRITPPRPIMPGGGRPMMGLMEKPKDFRPP